MKKQILVLVATLGITLILSASHINAQVHSQMAANIPFDFYAGDQKLKAGEYLIRSVNPQSGGNAIAIARKEGKASAIVILTKADLKTSGSAAKPSLFFNQYGNEYVLSEVQNPNELFAGTAAISKMEKGLRNSNEPVLAVAVAMETVKRK